MTSEKSPQILFLTTQDPANIKAEWPFYQNWTLPRVIEEHGARVSIRCWQDQSLDTSTLIRFDVITFLWCNDYHSHAAAFKTFLHQVLVPAQKRSPTLRVVNDTAVILWNMDKETYLTELAKAGFLVPETAFVKDIQTPAGKSDFEKKLASFAVRVQPLVLKPSISGSSKQTHLVQTPSKLNTADTKFLKSIFEDGIDGSLLIQRYESGIEKGEYSMIFINGKHTHTMLKTPPKNEFRCQQEFGGGIEEVAKQNVPPKALETAESIVKWLQGRFSDGVDLGSTQRGGEWSLLNMFGPGLKMISSGLIRTCLSSGHGTEPPKKKHIGEDVSKAGHSKLVYVRVDGVLRDNGDFVLMEVEAIEPHLWLETSNSPACREELYKALLGV